MWVELQRLPTIKQPFTADAVYQHHWWIGRVKPIRVGPSLEHWDLHIDWQERGPLMNWILQDDLRTVDETVATLSFCKDRSFMEKGEKGPEYIPPGKPGNPTKDTPAYIQILDKGTVRFYSITDDYVIMDIRMKNIKGHYLFARRDPRLNLWNVSKEERAPGLKP
jgi:hypothetical protein